MGPSRGVCGGEQVRHVPMLSGVSSSCTLEPSANGSAQTDAEDEIPSARIQLQEVDSAVIRRVR